MKILLVFVSVLLFLSGCGVSLNDTVDTQLSGAHPAVENTPMVLDNTTDDEADVATQSMQSPATYDFRIFGIQDFSEHFMEIYDIVEYYASLDYQHKPEFLYSLPLSENELNRSLEIIGYTETEYAQLTTDAISKEELMWYVSMGIVEGSEEDLTDTSYPIIRRGEFGHIPYVTINGVEYCLILENPEEYDVFVHERYFQEIQYDLLDIAYNPEHNYVTAIVSSSLGSVLRVQINFNKDGLIERVDRAML